MHELVVTCPADVRRVGDPVALHWVKRRMKCVTGLPGETFTEWCRRSRRGRSPAGLPGHAARRWRSGESPPPRPPGTPGLLAAAHAAFRRRRGDPGGRAAPVAHLGIDEHRRGRPRPAQETHTGRDAQLADRWHVASTTCTGTRACSARSRAAPLTTPRTGWPAPPAWPDPVQVAAIDMCPSSSPPSAACSRGGGSPLTCSTSSTRRQDHRRRAPPRHPRALRPPRQGRRPRHGIKNLLNRNPESLSPENFAKIIETLDANAPGQHPAPAWIAKEKLRDALKLRARVTAHTPCERLVRDRLFAFYDWCAQNEDITELVTLAAPSHAGKTRSSPPSSPA